MKYEYFYLQYLDICPWHHVNTGKVYSCQYWCIVFKDTHKLTSLFYYAAASCQVHKMHC